MADSRFTYLNSSSNGKLTITAYDTQDVAQQLRMAIDETGRSHFNMEHQIMIPAPTVLRACAEIERLRAELKAYNSAKQSMDFVAAPLEKK